MELSIVIPAYNEAKRLTPYLNKLISYCKKSERTYEIIVVDDGSNDGTVESITKQPIQFDNLHIIQLKKNRGKGAAVKAGMFRAKGEICLFLDADGSVEPEEIEKNIHYILKDGYDIFVGSRVLRSKEQLLNAKWYRVLIGKVFNFFVHTLLFKEIRDTQCGFKMFRKDTVEPLFARSYLKNFGFDIELLYLALKMGYRIKEGPISWCDVPMSKVNLVTDSIKMFFNILQVRNWHCTPINTQSKYLGPDEYKYMYEMENYHWWFVSRRHLVEKLIKTTNISAPTILDVGMGTGGNMLAFSKFGKVFGIDIAEQAIEFCRRRGLQNVTQCPAEKIKCGDKNFDIITCLDLLEHVSDPVRTLTELKRILKDNGRIIMTAAALKILWSQHDEALCHLRRYDKNALLHDATEAGLKVKKMGYFFFMSFFAVAPIRILRKFFLSRYKLVSDTTTLPPKFLNEFLKFLFNVELKLIGDFGAPFGTTLYGVLAK